MADVLDRLKTALGDRYAIERELGRGGMATVYLAEDLKHHRQVAVKVLRAELAAVLGAERFLREIQIAARLSHPHILPLHDSGEAEGFLYYVMPYVEGESLRDRVDREKQLPLDDALQIAREVADALSYAHSHAVVHRDIKPENILLAGGHALVADFGIARALTAAGGEKLTQTGVAVGTPIYMSPEQASGRQHLDGRSDLYSLGCVVYEMLAGQPPFTGPSAESVIRQHLTADPPSVTLMRSAVPAAVGRALARALAKTPADRFVTAAQFADALAMAEAKREPAPQRVPRWRVVRLLSAALALVGLGLAVWRPWRSRSGSPEPASPPAIAVFPFSVHGGGQVAYLGEGLVNLLGRSLDGAGDLRSVDARALLGAVHRERGGTLEPERARLISERLGARVYIVGDVYEIGGRVRIDASLYDGKRGRDPAAQATAEGEPTQIFHLVDDLAARLLGGWRGGPAARVTQIAAVTTHSLAALKAYLEGERAFRAGLFGAAADAFKRAIALDSSFALAYYRLSMAAEWLTQADLGRYAAAEAVRRSTRLSEHDRLVLQATLATRDGAAEEAERLYRSTVGTYPDDVEAWYLLGEVLFHYGPIAGRSVAESRDAFERVLSFEPDNLASLVHVARIAAAAKEGLELDSVVDRMVTLSPESERSLEMLALRALSLKDTATEARVLAQLERASDLTLVLSVWTTSLFSGDLLGAKRLAHLLAQPRRSPDVRAVGYAMSAHLELARGRWRAAKAELASAEPLDRAAALEYRALLAMAPVHPVPRGELAEIHREVSRWNAAVVSPMANRSTFFTVHNPLHPRLRDYVLGILSARLGEEADALRHAAELERASRSRPEVAGLLGDLALGARAEVALARGQLADALKELERTRADTWYEFREASPFYSEARERYIRAEALSALGRREEALRWYSSFAEVSPYDLVYLAPSELKRAEIHEQLGQRDKAVEHYSRFVALWNDCDEELRPLVEEARARLARLTKEPVRTP